MSAITAPAEHRLRCYRCWRPVATCFCSELPAVPTRTSIVILQHPHERSHPFGTARLTALCLPQSRIHVAYKGLSGDLNCPVDVPRDAAVLFPHPSAVDLADLPAAERPTTLVVLDGTWAHSKRLHRENPWLQRLRHVRLRPVEPSRYRIRREPQPDYVSTVEAVVQALRILEPATPGLDSLLAAFDRMIDRQVEIVARIERRGRTKSERLRASRKLSPLLLDPRLVVAYAESSLPGGVPTATRELVQWVAARVRTGEVFEALVRPAGAWPSPHHLAHMQLEPATLACGETLSEATQRFLAFAEPDAPIAAWTQSTLDWGSSVIGTRPRTVLKTSYCNLRNHRASFLETVLQREHLDGVDNGCHGRARERLGNALAVARWLCEGAAEGCQSNRAPRTARVRSTRNVIGR